MSEVGSHETGLGERDSFIPHAQPTCDRSLQLPCNQTVDVGEERIFGKTTILLMGFPSFTQKKAYRDVDAHLGNSSIIHFLHGVLYRSGSLLLGFEFTHQTLQIAIDYIET